MKTEISKQSFTSTKNFSGVYLQQGRMITDADWNEQGLLQHQRHAAGLNSSIGSGIPEQGGLGLSMENGALVITPGALVVHGYQAVLQGINPIALNEQQGLRHMVLPEQGSSWQVYADVWQRTVTGLEDQDLMDPALDGADTCSRQQTMVQVKWCEGHKNPLTTPQNPGKGNGKLAIHLRAAAEAADICEPCNVDIDLPARVGNYLFRCEVHHVEGPANNPTGLTLKWSSENGAIENRLSEMVDGEVVEHSLPASFWQDMIFEYFDAESDKQLGNHLAGSAGWPTASLCVRGDSPDTAPRSMVRRWDGCCTLEKISGEWQLASNTLAKDTHAAIRHGLADNSYHGYCQINDGVLSLGLKDLLLELTLTNRSFVAGDYWLAPVRENIHSRGSYVLGSADESVEAEGILHHYLPLAKVVHGVLAPVDFGHPAYPYPTLTNLKASNIGFANNGCNQQLFDESMTVQQALDCLCQLKADQVAIEPVPGCLEGEEQTTVQDALSGLCQKIDAIPNTLTCATYVIHPGAGWEQIFAQLPSKGNVHICFREGEYMLAQPVSLKNLNSVTMSGAGRGTHIRCQSNEAVFRLENCTEVLFRDLFLESGGVGSGKGEHQHLSGTIAMRNCRLTVVENCLLMCGAGTRKAASCLSVWNDPTKVGQIRVQGCECNVGHGQIGILVINSDQTTVRDSYIHTRPKPKSMAFGKMLADVRVRKQLIGHIVQGAMVRGIKDNKRKHTIARGGYQLAFNSILPGADIKKIISNEVNDSTINSNQQLLSQLKKAMDTVLASTEKRELYSGLRSIMRTFGKHNPSLAAQGIVVTGQKAGKVHITDNRFVSVSEGIRVATSDYSEGQNRSCQAGAVHISGNSIHSLKSAVGRQSNCLIFLGNCRRINCDDNTLTAVDVPGHYRQHLDGIRLLGKMGKLVSVCRNSMKNCSTGIFFQPVHDDAKNQTRWLVRDNVAQGSSKKVKLLSNKIVSDGNIS